MKNCKTIAEYMIKKWMQDNGFVMSEFSVKVFGKKGVITDRTGETLKVFYDQEKKSVYAEGEGKS